MIASATTMRAYGINRSTELRCALRSVARRTRSAVTSLSRSAAAALSADVDGDEGTIVSMMRDHHKQCQKLSVRWRASERGLHGPALILNRYREEALCLEKSSAV